MAMRATYFDPGFGHSFEEEWPELARRLDRFLAAKGVEPWLRADVVQETGARIYGKWPGLDRSRPLWNLVVTIALGVLVDERRKASRVDLVADAPEAELDDVAQRALHRIQLGKTRAALERLRPDQRHVLLAEVGEADALDGPRNRINVTRLRARAALKRQLGPWSPAGIALRFRSRLATVERRIVEWSRDAPGVVASIAGATIAATLLIPSSPPGAGFGNSFARSEPRDLLTSRAATALSNDLRRDALLRMASGIARSEVPRTGTGPGGAEEEGDGASTVVDNLHTYAEGREDYVHDRKRFVVRKRAFVQDRKEFAESKQDYVHDRKRFVLSKRGFVQDRKKYVEERRAWAEDRLS